MSSDGTYSNYPGAPEPSFEPITFEGLVKIMFNFADRQPAVPIAIRVHPDHMDVFMADLREEGFVKVAELENPFVGLPVIVDPDVKNRRWEFEYKHDIKVK